MGKLKTERIIIRDPHGRNSGEPMLDFKVDINVSQGGEFTCTLPEDVVEKLTQALIEVKTNGRRNSRKGFFAASTMPELLKQVTDICEEYTSRELLSEELIIRYIIETACSYVKDNESFYPNGRYVSREKWTNGERKFSDGTLYTSAASPEPFGMRLWTSVCHKRVYLYKSGKTKEEYENYNADVYGQDKEDPIIWLSNVVSIRPPKGNVQEIPCTVESADFFVNIYKVVFKINEGIKQFATDAFMITKFIEQKQKLLF